MAYSTQQLRDAWNPACQALYRKNILEAYRALDAIFKKYGYRPKEGETWGFNCRPITGGSNYSLHAYRSSEIFTFWTGVSVTISIAVDINSKSNPYGPNLITDMPRAMVEEICAVRTNSGHQVWGWGGYYKNNKDAMHFELNCFPDQLATGIAPYPAQNGQTQEEEMNAAQEATLNATRTATAQLVDAESRDFDILKDIQQRISDLENKVGSGGGGAGGLTDQDIAKIATAVSDMLARRIVD